MKMWMQRRKFYQNRSMRHQGRSCNYNWRLQYESFLRIMNEVVEIICNPTMFNFISKMLNKVLVPCKQTCDTMADYGVVPESIKTQEYEALIAILNQTSR